MKENVKKTISVLDKIITFVKVICVIVLLCVVSLLAIQRFSNNEKSIFGYRMFNVATASMVPDYKVGDVLIVKEVDLSTLKIGDDITYKGLVGSFKDKVVTHRLIDIEVNEDGIIYHTKGIANEAPDPTIQGDQIYGKVLQKSVIMSGLTKLVNNMTAVYVLIFIPLGIVVFLQIKDFAFNRDEEEDDEEDDDEEDDEEDDD